MTLEERRKVIAHCEEGMIGIVGMLRTLNGKYEKYIDADKMIKGIKWFCGDNSKDLTDYIED